MLLEALRSRLPTVRFEPGETFLWSPKQQLICYPAESIDNTNGSWALLHEASHGILGHTNYQTDFELLLLEVAAWEHARILGSELNIPIDEDHIQDCLDTYRDWLHRRSTCPTCGVVGLQREAREYSCHNCNTSWQVSTSRFCRPYRLKARGRTNGASEQKSPALFR